MIQQSLFITKEVSEAALIRAFCDEQNVQFSAHSFLQFEALPFALPSDFEIVFFTSPRAVNYFFASHSLPPTVSIACAGATTKSIIEELGFQVSFVPQNSGTVSESSAEFKKWVGTRTVLFPVSSISKRSYARVLNADQCIEIQTYKTHIEPRKVDFSDIYIFTSPSNVEGFFSLNSLKKNALLIAWGETTLLALQMFTSLQIIKLTDSSEQEVIKVLSKLT